LTPDLFSLEGCVALITGGNGGIGRGMAVGLRAAGARVVVTGRDQQKNAAAAVEFGADAVFELDVRDEEAVAACLAEVAQRFGRLDVLVNNAGLFRGGSVLNLSRADWDAVIATHLTGSFLCSKHAANVMLRGGRGGKIVNIGSMYSVFGAPSSSDYASAKTGLLGLTRSLAIELAPYRIQVNAILPGWFETGLTRGIPSSRRGEQIRRTTPSNRWGEIEDLTGTVIYLSSRASDFVTGIAIPVDGGYSISERSTVE
jgi:2-deoxy-D-gluconate 3-dehydrogenase